MDNAEAGAAPSVVLGGPSKGEHLKCGMLHCRMYWRTLLMPWTQHDLPPLQTGISSVGCSCAGHAHGQC